jgi:hypothetical protein
MASDTTWPGGGNDMTLVSKLSTPASTWSRLIISAAAVSTPFVLVARDIEELNEFSNIKRSMRLLQDPTVGALAGATRNEKESEEIHPF